jgi:hypothetical protein
MYNESDIKTGGWIYSRISETWFEITYVDDSTVWYKALPYGSTLNHPIISWLASLNSVPEYYTLLKTEKEKLVFLLKNATE